MGELHGAGAFQIPLELQQAFKLAVEHLHEPIEEHVRVEVESQVEVISTFKCLKLLDYALVRL